MPAGRGREQEWAAIEAERARRRYLLVPEVAEQLGRSVGHVRERYVGRGLIEASRHLAGGVHVLLVSPDALKRFRRAWPSGGDGRRKVWSEDDHYISWAMGRGRLQALMAAGLSEIQALRVLQEEAREHRRLFHGLPGPEPGSAPRQHVSEWHKIFGELEDYYERMECAGDGPRPTRRKLALLTAQEHASRYGDRAQALWKYDPWDPAFAQNTASRVLGAIKPLQAGEK